MGDKEVRWGMKKREIAQKSREHVSRYNLRENIEWGEEQMSNWELTAGFCGLD